MTNDPKTLKARLLKTAGPVRLNNGCFADLAFEAAEALDQRDDRIETLEAAVLPDPTSHASTSPGPVNCSIRKRHQGETYPRTCERCGLGPCPFFHNDGEAKRASLNGGDGK